MIIFRKNDNEHLFPKIIIMGIYVSLYLFFVNPMVPKRRVQPRSN